MHDCTYIARVLNPVGGQPVPSWPFPADRIDLDDDGRSLAREAAGDSASGTSLARAATSVTFPDSAHG